MAASSVSCSCGPRSRGATTARSLGWASSASVPRPTRPAKPQGGPRPPHHRSLTCVCSATSPAAADACSTSSSPAGFSRRHGLLSAATLLATATFLKEGTHWMATAAEEDLLETVRSEVQAVVKPGNAPSILRLVFHDAGTFNIANKTGGMNGSIIQELDRDENFGLRKPVKILQKAKDNIDRISPVSWADLIAVAGTEAVAVCGGPVINVKLGRLDASTPDPEGQLPAENLPAAELKQVFQNKGLTTRELVALLGSHTIGSKGFGASTEFDNSYYKVLLSRPSPGSMVGIPTDRAISNDDECYEWIKTYAEDQELFFKDFSSAYLKMVDSGARWRA